MRSVHFLTILFTLFCFAACDDLPRGRTGPAEVIRLDRLERLPVKKPVESDTFRVAVAAILSPQGTVDSYRPLMAYMERVVGKPVRLVQRRTYQEINALLGRGVVDVAFICTGAYLEGVEKGQLSLLVVPEINGKVTYRALIIVPAASPAVDLENLQGKVFAFTDPISNTGYRYPVSLLKKRGVQPESFFSRTIFTYSHDRSIAAVMEGVADGASVDNLVYAYARKRDPSVATKSKIIRQSGEFGMPPVVVPGQAKPEKRERLRRIFLGLHQDQEGRRALDVLSIDRFVEPEMNLYRLP